MVEAGGAGGGAGVVAGGGLDGDGELGLLEAQAGEFLERGLGEAWCCGLTFAAQLGSEVLEDVQVLLEVLGKASKGFFTLLEVVEFRLGFVGEAEDGLRGGAVFATEGLEEVQPLGQGGEALGVHIDGGGVPLDGLLEVSQELGGLMVEGGGWVQGGVKARELLEGTTDGGHALDEGIVVIGEQGEEVAGELEDAGRVVGPGVVGREGFFLPGLETSHLDFGYLVSEEVALPFDGGGISDEGIEVVAQAVALVDGVGEGTAKGGEAGEGVEDGKLSSGFEERLMVVGAVQVDEPLAEVGERGECGGRAVDELPVGSRRGERSANDEGPGLAGIEAGVGEDGVDGALASGGMEDGLDGAEVGPGSDGGAVCPLAEDELDGSEDDGLAGSGLAGDDVQSRAQVEREVWHQGEVADA